MAAVFDPSVYDTVPKTSIPGTLALIRSLITAAQPDLPTQSAPAKKALKRARTKGESLRSQYSAEPAQKTASVTRAADSAVDRAWIAFEGYLVSIGDVEDAFHPHAKVARELHAVLFPEGTSFLKLPYAEQWAHGDAILTRLGASERAASIAKVGATPFVEHVKAKQADYGKALGVTKAKDAPVDASNLIEPLREVQQAIAVYARVLTAAVQNEELDADVAMRALAPIAALRVRIKERKKTGATDDEPVVEPVTPEPLPPVA